LRWLKPVRPGDRLSARVTVLKTTPSKSVEDIYDAAIACWSAVRLSNGEARSLPDDVSRDATGLPMAIWI
jgi:acyl dehydratase